MVLNVGLLRSNIFIKMSVAEMRMLRYISGNIRKDMIRNEKIRLKIGVTSIDEKMRECHLRWFGHVQGREINASVRKSELIQVEGTKEGRGRPKITLIEVVKK
jgi:hypothetical protein